MYVKVISYGKKNTDSREDFSDRPCNLPKVLLLYDIYVCIICMCMYVSYIPYVCIRTAGGVRYDIKVVAGTREAAAPLICLFLVYLIERSQPTRRRRLPPTRTCGFKRRPR